MQQATFLADIITAIHRRLELFCEWLEAVNSSAETDRGTRIPLALDPTIAENGAVALLVERFGLTRFERDLLLLSLAAEISPAVEALCGRANRNPQRPFPTFALAVELLAESHWDALAPTSPLRKWHLIEIAAGDTLWASPLRIDERIMHYLLDAPSIDKRLVDIVQRVENGPPCPTSHAGIVERISGACLQNNTSPVVQLHGSDTDSMVAIMAAAAAKLGLPLFRLPAANIPSSIEEQLGIALLWDRETILGSGILAIDYDDSETGALATVAALMERIRSPLFSLGREPIPVRSRTTIPVEVRIPTHEEQKEFWDRYLTPSPPDRDSAITTVAAQFNLSGGQIRSIGDEIAGLVPTDDSDFPAELWNACRRQSRRHMDGLAHRIEPKAGWDDLILPHAQKETLRQIAGHVRQRRKVYQEWGFGARNGRGLGITALFAGASGTGKTMSAEVLANELNLDLYQIDLSQMVSKYIGETEKNLRRIFDVADEAGAILLFDEADALFGKRSEVKDSHDRYANLEVSYLLQRMESYRGLAILTTNMKQALDTAFLRRIRFVVNYPFPEPTERAEIWWRTIPSGTPTQGLDFAKLASLNVSGGSIWNIALNAAFLAADGGEPLRMKHMLLAARSEYAKLEKQLTDAEVRGWI